MTPLGFSPSSYLASPGRLSSITACTSWSRSPGDGVHLSSSSNQSRKQRWWRWRRRRRRLQFHSQQRCRNSSVQRSSTLCNFSAKWILLICRAGMAPGPQDNVDGWCFNAAECYFYWTGKTINFYFSADDCGLCINAASPMNNRRSQQMLLCRNQFLG